MLSAFSCNEYIENVDVPCIKGVIGVAAFEGSDPLGEVTTYEVGKRQAKTINLKAIAEEVSGSGLKVTFGADPELVNAYNEANGTSYEMLPGEAYRFSGKEMLMPRYNVYSAQDQLTLIGQGCVEDQFYLLPVTITKVVGSDNYSFSEKNGVIYFIMKVLPSKKGTGTKADPFLLEELEDIKTMNEKLLPGDVVYFDLKADIDMTPITEWTALNKSLDCNVIFNGNGHTISNFKANDGFFHCLNGTIENLIIDNAAVSTSGNGRAVLANFVGYSGGVKGHVKNVTIKNSKNDSASGQSVGVLAGAMYNSLIENVYLENCTLRPNGRRVGLLVGKIINGDVVSEIKNCYVKGGSITGQQQVGGIVGEVEKTSSKISFCGCSAEMIGDRAQASIVGYYNGTAGKENTLENCIAWSPKIVAAGQAPGTSDKYSSGAVVGCALAAQGPFTFKNCYYRPDMEFVDYSEINTLSSMGNIENGALSPDSANHQYNYPWHGTAAAAGKTASAVAKDLGWDEAIWDLSGDEPKLK